MLRGRPMKTEIREKIASLLATMGTSYGYEIYKAYLKVFGKISLRNLYYNLRKGLENGEFVLVDIKSEVGDYTWGGEVRHIYYSVGPYVKMYNTTDRMNLRMSDLERREVEIDWEKEIHNQIGKISKTRREYDSKKAALRYEEKVKIRNTLSRKAELLKEWMKNKFDKQRAHELRVEIDNAVKDMT